MATVTAKPEMRERRVVLPYWLDRPAEEAVAIGLRVPRRRRRRRRDRPGDGRAPGRRVLAAIAR